MPVPGVKPTEGQKRHRGIPHTEWTEVEDIPYSGSSPDLPEATIWPDQTRAWYEVVRRLPHAVLWDDGEWQEIATTALIHAAIWRDPTKPSASNSVELRQREKSIGLTADQRRDLRIRYVEPLPESEDPEVPDDNVIVLNPRLRPRSDALDT